MSYRYLEDWTFADVAFEATGKTLEDLFQSALDATMNVMVSDLASIEFKEIRKDHLDAVNEADLLHDFLQKALYYKDADQLLLRADRVLISRENERITLNYTLRGESINPRKHELVADVKAVTHHRFEIKRSGSDWIATVVLDV